MGRWPPCIHGSVASLYTWVGGLTVYMGRWPHCIHGSVASHSVGETGASCIQGHVVTEAFYENIAYIWNHHRQ